MLAHITEVVSGEGPLAKLVAKLVEFRAKQLEHLAAVQAELVRRRGDVGPTIASGSLLATWNTRLREAGQFLA